MEKSNNKAALFWSLVTSIVVVDVITKLIAVSTLVPMRVPREVIGDWVRLTLVYNRGAAFGLHLGPYSRWIFLVLTVVALVILWRLYKTAAGTDWLRVLALGMVCGGAVGNLIDRVRSPLGVVDFLDIGVGNVRWPTFNVADIAVSLGAILLAWSLWNEEREAAGAVSPRAANEGA